MKTLILTEKPSVARDFAYALKVSPTGSGFFENATTVITWAIGHLMQLKDPHEYDLKWKSWSLQTLPILPDRLLYKPNEKTKKQLSIVLKQLKRKDIDRIILATDAGREGELIGRTLIHAVSSKASLYRFWTSQALNPSVIKDNMSQLKPLKEYDRLYYAGRSRQSADWLVGMNLSRLATIKMGELFSVGRVQTAVLALLVNRQEEISSFKSKIFFTINGSFDFKGGTLLVNWFNPSNKSGPTHIETHEQAIKIIEKCEIEEATIQNVKRDKKSQPSPQLFSLTELQKTANRLFGFSAQKTLTLAQSLYEKHKCLSYPRTDARVLGSKSLNQVNKLLAIFKEVNSDYFQFFNQDKVSLHNKRVFNDAKLSDHHALIPLKNISSSASHDERKIFDLILKRFAMVFSFDFEYEETKVLSRIKDEYFKSTGKRVICLGWKSLSGGEKDHILPFVKEKECTQKHSLKTEEKTTNPPLHYTEATLLQDMINPSRLVDEQEFKRAFRGDIGLGTQATRAQIIETLIMRKYIERQGKSLLSLSRGEELIKNFKTMKLSKLLASPTQTAQWELELSKIANGDYGPKEFMVNIRKFVLDCTSEWKETPIKMTSSASPKSSSQEILGKCPLCKNAITESPKSFSCEKWREGCKFTIWKSIATKKISKSQVIKILRKGESDKLKGFKSRAGKKFDAVLKIQGEGVVLSS